jgi:hypothetical protein
MGLETLLGTLFEAPMHDALQPGRYALDNLRDDGRIFIQDGCHRLRRRRPLECALAGQHLVQDRSKGEDVGAMVDWSAADLLGSHVTDRAHHQARIGPGHHGRLTAV